MGSWESPSLTLSFVPPAFDLRSQKPSCPPFILLDVSKFWHTVDRPHSYSPEPPWYTCASPDRHWQRFPHSPTLSRRPIRNQLMDARIRSRPQPPVPNELRKLSWQGSGKAQFALTSSPLTNSLFWRLLSNTKRLLASQILCQHIHNCLERFNLYNSKSRRSISNLRGCTSCVTTDDRN